MITGNRLKTWRIQGKVDYVGPCRKRTRNQSVPTKDLPDASWETSDKGLTLTISHHGQRSKSKRRILRPLINALNGYRYTMIGRILGPATANGAVALVLLCSLVLKLSPILQLAFYFTYITAILALGHALWTRNPPSVPEGTKRSLRASQSIKKR